MFQALLEDEAGHHLSVEELVQVEEEISSTNLSESTLVIFLLILYYCITTEEF